MIARACDFAPVPRSAAVARAHQGVTSSELLPWADPYIAQLVRELEAAREALGEEASHLEVHHRPAIDPAVASSRFAFTATPV